MTDSKPAIKVTKTTANPRKPQKITYPRLYNALEEVVKDAGLASTATIDELYEALDTAIVRDARGK